jgi:pimeloyl-ACP methyl ester carboxylesterase
MRVALRPLLKLAAGFAAAIALASGCASFDEWQRRSIFQNEGSVRYGDREPPAGGHAFDLQLANGDRVHTWYVPAAERNAPTLLFLHGARRNLAGSAGRIEMMRSLGFHVLAIDYRGFGRSSVLLPSERSAAEDTRAAFAELVRREPDPSRRFVYGYSLGGALAIDLAAQENGIAGVVVESTFTSIAELVRTSRWGWVPMLDSIVTQGFDSIGKIAQVQEPVLLIHGTADGVIPHVMSDRLYTAAINVPPDLRRLLKIDGGTHWGSAYAGGEAYARTVRDFVAAARQATRALMAAPAAASTATTTVDTH